ncbi:hypothetical protein FI667_g12747, partial [Globisporangium splendens]
MDPMELRFPLDEGLLPKLYPDAGTVSKWTQAAKTEITNVVLNRNSWYYRGDELKNAFKLAYEKESLKGYTRDAQQQQGKKEFLCQGHIQLPLDDISYGLYSETTFEQRSVQAQLFQEHFLDAAILHVAERQSGEDTFLFAGVKWAAYSSSGASAAPRDYVYFEYSCKTKDADGRDVIVQYAESPKLFRHQLEEHDMGLVRSNMFVINTFRLDGDNGTFCQSAGSFENSKSGSSRGSSKAIEHVFRSLLNLVGLADARAIMNLGVLKKVPKSPADNDKKVCFVCTKKFNMLTRARQTCRSCGRYTCRHCIVGLKFFNETSLYSSTLPVTTEKFCLKCIMHSRQERQFGGTLSFSGNNNVMSMSMSSASVNSDSNTIGSFDVDYKSSSITSESDAFVHDVIAKLDAGGSSSFDMNDLRKKLSTAAETDDEIARVPRAKTASSSRLTSPVNYHLLDPVPGSHAPTQRSHLPTSTVTPPPTMGAAPDFTAFSNMAQSIAAQNTLLKKIHQEGQKMMGRRNTRTPSAQFVDSPPISPCGRKSFTADADRFEILEA